MEELNIADRVAKKIASNTPLSAEEQRIVDGMNREEYDEIVSRYDVEQEWKCLHPRLGIPAREKQPFSSPKTTFTWKRMIAAASMLLLLSAGYITLTLLSDRTPLPQADIAPGEKKATLTLADGNTLILEKESSGVVARQGEHTFIVQENEQLIYQTGSGDTTRQETLNTLSTPAGGEYRLTLPDGSKVWLNAKSSITFPTLFQGEKRQVWITGEVYFEVARLDAANPFHVSVREGIVIEVLGTHFNINSYEEENFVKTTLLEGSVRVHPPHGGTPQPLRPGEQAIINDTGHIEVCAVDTDAVIAWKNGQFVFEKADIETVMRQLTRWYDVEVEYKGAISCHFGGVVSRDVNISNILHVLERTDEVTFEINNKKIIVYSKNKENTKQKK